MIGFLLTFKQLSVILIEAALNGQVAIVRQQIVTTVVYNLLIDSVTKFHNLVFSVHR
jgi:hypothetical protein